MSALGETFRTARESQGFSLSDVTDRIHIRTVYLAAIEAEDWQAIGPAVYVRGFIRSYARFLGLDADAAVAQFGGGPATGSSAPLVTYAPSPRGEPSRSGLPRGEIRKAGPSPLAVAGVIVALALVALAGYRYLELSRAGKTIAARPADRSAARPVHSRMPHEPAAAVQTPEVRSPAKNLARSSGFAVRLKDSSWLRVVIDGKVAMEGLYPAGTSRTFSGRSATVRVGNAGGVNVTVDGKDLGPMGGLGDVAERSFQL